jgi:hypothetical protein
MLTKFLGMKILGIEIWIITKKIEITIIYFIYINTLQKSDLKVLIKCQVN